MEAEKVNKTLNDVQDRTMLSKLAALVARVNSKTLGDTLAKVKAITLGEKVSNFEAEAVDCSLRETLGTTMAYVEVEAPVEVLDDRETIGSQILGIPRTFGDPLVEA